MIDIPALMRSKAIKDASDRMIALNISLAPHIHDEHAFKRLVDGLRADADTEADDDSVFDKRSLDKLRSRLGS